MSKPSPWQMLSSRCFCLNQYHEEFSNIFPHKGVGLAWVNSTTFIFNYCKLFDSPNSYIAKTQTTIAWISSYVSTPTSPHFLNVVLPYKWLDNEIRGMLQCLLAFLNEIIPPSITSMASSGASLIHLLLMLSTMLHLLSFLCFLIGFCAEDGETFFLSCVGCCCYPFRLLWGTFNIMI